MDDKLLWLGDSPTENICHYTSADSALKILGQQRLRLGPFRTSNDPYENSIWIPRTTGGGGTSTLAGQLVSDIDCLKDRINRVAFVKDDSPQPTNYVGSDICHRGFGSFPMWAHYGDHFRGACLVFNRHELVNAAIATLESQSELIEDRIIDYDPHPIQASDNYIDENAIDYVRRNKDALLFHKRKEWSYENEFRIVSISRTVGAQYVPIKTAVLGIILGSRCALVCVNLGHQFEIPVACQAVQSGKQWLWPCD